MVSHLAHGKFLLMDLVELIKCLVQEKQKQEDLLKEYFLHDNLSKSFKTKENY